MNISTTIKTQREKHHLSQNGLAQKIFVTRQAISKWENGTSLPSLDNIIALSDVLEVSLDELIKGDERVMEKFSTDSKWNTFWKIFGVSMLLGIIVYNLLVHLLHVSLGTIAFWATPVSLLAFLVMIVNLNFKHLKRSFNKVALIAMIVLFVCFIVPSLHDFMAGFWRGWHDAGH